MINATICGTMAIQTNTVSGTDGHGHITNVARIAHISEWF
jgi:hypothetical protein